MMTLDQVAKLLEQAADLDGMEYQMKPQYLEAAAAVRWCARNMRVIGPRPDGHVGAVEPEDEAPITLGGA